ncbi:AcrR family transcriptional regulator [Erythromicrobium ramosum]|uniref:AcrR family transcriptional regulator n=2 Tax=Erythrobacter ramosus TaxID=35811 RepID=A0ABR6I248_9SPHN|nr:AcrR family transcriptional regulator [Erythrobacter ramosus]
MQQSLDRSMNDNNSDSMAKPDPVMRQGYNQHGQKIGSKGERTRNTLIASTVELLETHGLRDVSVADVARRARTSPATFYVYFRDVADVVLAALEYASQTSPELEQIVAQDWLATGNEACSRRFVDSYCELWNRHRTIFRVRNMAAEQGDGRFYAARMSAALPLMEVLTAKIEQAQLTGLVPIELKPRSCAGTVLMMLERLAAIGPVTRKDDDISYESLRAAAAHSVALMIGAFR